MELLNSLLLLFLIYLIHSFYIKNKRIHKNEAKGPIGFPLIGNMIQIGKTKPHIELMKLEKIYNQRILKIWLGDYYSVFLSDIDLIKDIFINKFENFSSRPKSPLTRLGTNDFRGINGSSGETWFKNKNIIVNAMKRANTKTIYTLLDNQVNDLIKEISKFESQNKSFNPKYYFRKFVLSTMFKYIFNEDVPYDENLENGKLSELTMEMENIFKTLKVGKLANSIEILETPYYYYLQKTDKVFKNIKKLIIEKYKNHNLSINPEKPRDLLDILINEYGTTDDDVLNITQVTLDMFMAGTDTTANTLEWIIIKLCNSPIHQEIAYNELKKVVSSKVIIDDSIKREITLSDRPNTPYIQAIIKETMRMHPVVVFGLPRYCENDIFIGDENYFIPKGCKVFINFHSIGYNEKYFKDPYKFEPNRFLENSNNSMDSFFPFGLGNRVCLGRQLANDQLYLVIANLILKYKLKTIDENKINEDGIFGLTVSPNKYKINLESR
ncbi:cytochrome P450 family protein [Dictyostelium discoideum AX4]|uniref:Probable cytochrome P450 508C1 n=1 Tax=Dictyostelium discoideum TaxID=44689 RepID=C508C_DICDI|nr:cytochrome P450 family protein [Dictyostelium discoideum AX4]Q54CS3.1 RecName: Full=Probable cytochrome P450 508C1 [Dictyostelium discoideum]EAL61070.1 cytochrome P450 family protein [Dictyostelium discoideum AX4]|eukprot:XP_629468.1 cytochrome P450 family protein [Dictyostelium discoideum AX4]